MTIVCKPECWEPKPCPDCGLGMDPRGRSKPLGYGCTRDDCPAHVSEVNPRHLWSEHDSTRHYTDPDGWKAHEAACSECGGFGDEDTGVSDE